MPETISNFLLQCPIYTPIRSRFLNKYIQKYSELDGIQILQNILCIGDIEQMNDLYCYIGNALKIRSFIINE